MSARAKNDQELVTMGSKSSLLKRRNFQQNQAQGREREERNKTIKETIGEKASLSKFNDD